MKQPVLLVFGTRPEAIKLSPLITALRASPDINPIVCVTGQHSEMLHQVLRAFGIQADHDLQAMRPGQSLPSLTSRLLAALPEVFAGVTPALTVVQGDTTTTFCASLSSFYAGVPVAHVEAGLRTFDLQAPYPEEMNRVLTSRIARLHFAATQSSADNLLREGIPGDAIEVTGNTGIDALLNISRRLADGELSGLELPLDSRKKLIVVTAHRRESFGASFENICNALRQLAERDDVQIVWPVHRNPTVFETVNTILPGKANVLLIEPLGYVSFVDLLRRAYLVITDSGGIQEEGPSLGKPILVLRDKTERPEAVGAGTVRLVGTDRDTIIRETAALLDNQSEYLRMSRLYNPYGDGRASARIVQRIASYLQAR